MKTVDWDNFARCFVSKNGNVSTGDLKKYGIPFEYFLRIAQLSDEQLSEIVSKLKEMGY